MGRFSQRLIDLLKRALQSRRSQRPTQSRSEDQPSAEALGQQEAIRQEVDRRRKKQAADDEAYDEIELTGRGAATNVGDWKLYEAKRRLVQSSNVYAYLYIPETKRSGILYVTFLHWEPGMKADERSGPGSTYAYYDFPFSKYQQFEAATRESAGAAVWDYCRLRGSSHGHQHRYMLIQAEGDYVPRKATANGYMARALLPPNVELSERKKLPVYRPNTLPGQGRDAFPGVPNRGQPNRAKPNSGAPKRGTE